MSLQDEEPPAEGLPPNVTVWLTEQEAGEHVRLSGERLRYLRRVGGGPPFTKMPITGRPRYKRADLDAWMAGRARA